MKAALMILFVGIILTACPLAQANFIGADDFNDNTKDTSLWGPDIGGGVTLSETNQAVYLTGTANVGEALPRAQPWMKNMGSYTEDWSAQLDVNIPDGFLEDESHGVALGLTVVNYADWSDTADILLWYSDNYESGRLFDCEVDAGGIPEFSTWAPTTSTNAAVRLRWEASNTTLHMEYDDDGAANGYSWTTLGSTNLETEADWGMDTGSTFGLAMLAILEADEATTSVTLVQADGVNMDNFNAVPEPSSFVLAAVGLLGLLAFYGRRKRFRISDTANMS